MGIENFWHQLKHNYLHNTPRPRLDHLVHVLIHNVSSSYLARLKILQDDYRIRRSKPLNTFQTYFKQNWIKQFNKELGHTTYETDVANWTCTCGSQKFDRHHLCKHLVHAVPQPGIKFWREIRRRRVSPLYRHPALIQIGQSDDSLEEPTVGSITDGDDYDTGVARTGKRKLRPNDLELDQTTSSASTASKRSAGDSDIEMITQEQFERRDRALSYDSDGEQERQNFRAELLKQADALEYAAKMFRRQATETRNSDIWIASIVRRKVAQPVVDLVADVRRHEKTGRTRDTTWGQGKDKISQRRVNNTMGYVFLPDEGTN
ncbi:hypothetical protein BJ912DRAFT_970082 [Pholiota molesta]|nr:hypothetical protein BJ912DRAFT_970082 [Pholiota molesta]